MFVKASEMVRIFGSPAEVANYYRANPQQSELLVTISFANSDELVKQFTGPDDLAAQLPDPQVQYPGDTATNEARKVSNPTNVTLVDWVNLKHQPVEQWPGLWY